jgi:hypothetical protein
MKKRSPRMGPNGRLGRSRRQTLHSIIGLKDLVRRVGVGIEIGAHDISPSLGISKLIRPQAFALTVSEPSIFALRVNDRNAQWVCPLKAEGIASG